MKQALWFGIKFVALTAPLTWLWVVADGRELFARQFFVPIAGTIYDALGLEIRAVWRERYIHFVPFIALVLLTPRLGARRRTLGLLGGLVAMFCADVVINGIAQYGHRRPVDLSMPLKVMSDALPFAVWAVVAQRFVADLARGAVGSAFGFPTESADPEPAIREDRASDEPAEPPRD
jgi:hypothetical protein